MGNVAHNCRQRLRVLMSRLEQMQRLVVLGDMRAKEKVEARRLRGLVDINVSRMKMELQMEKEGSSVERLGMKWGSESCVGND